MRSLLNLRYGIDIGATLFISIYSTIKAYARLFSCRPLTPLCSIAPEAPDLVEVVVVMVAAAAVEADHESATLIPAMA